MSVSPEALTTSQYLPQDLSNQLDSGTPGLAEKVDGLRINLTKPARLVVMSFVAWVDVPDAVCDCAQRGSGWLTGAIT